MRSSIQAITTLMGLLFADGALKVPAIPEEAAGDFIAAKKNVVIIGAGVAGLMAAATLKKMGVENFVVLEASDRYGGRLKSIDGFADMEVPLDLGAEWIHAADGQIVRDLLVFPPSEDDEGLEPSEFIKYKPSWHFRNRKSRILTYLYEETKWKRSTWWNWLDRYTYQLVQDKVYLNSPVTEIDYNDDRLRLVVGEGEEVFADRVICTVPLALLQNDAITFDPPLPSKKQNAIDAIEVIAGFRILFEMKSKFYPDLTATERVFPFMKDALFGDLSLIYDALYGKELSEGKNVLEFVATGNKNAGQYRDLSIEDLAKAVLDEIDEIFDGQGSENYVQHVVQDWTNDPWAMGAYSTFSVPGDLFGSERINLASTVSDKLLFAGEHTAVEEYSTVPGAALEGRRAAVEAVSGIIL